MLAVWQRRVLLIQQLKLLSTLTRRLLPRGCARYTKQGLTAWMARHHLRRLSALSNSCSLTKRLGMTSSRLTTCYMAAVQACDEYTCWWLLCGRWNKCQHNGKKVSCLAYIKTATPQIVEIIEA